MSERGGDRDADAATSGDATTGAAQPNEATRPDSVGYAAVATPAAATPAEGAAAANAGGQLQRFRRPALALLSLSWAPLLASAVALVLSLASIYVSTREPEVVVILPDIVRLVGGRETGGSYVYLQPSFVSTGVNDRVEVLADMTLDVQPDDGSEGTEMAWREQVALFTDADGALSYRYEADAVPLLIGPRSAASPLALFQAPPGWFFKPGDYTFTLEADRVVGGGPLRSSFAVTLDPDDAAILDAPGPERFLAFPILSER